MSKPHARTIKHSTEASGAQRALLELLPAAIIVTQYDGEIIYANSRTKVEGGFKIGQNIQDFYENPEEREKILTAIQEQGYLDDYEMRFRKTDGTLIWVLISSRRFEFEGIEAILSSLVDISGRKQAEEALRASEEKFRTIFMVSSDGIFISKPGGHGELIELNEAFADIVGYSRSELIGKSPLRLGLFTDAADREKLLSEIRLHGYCKEMELKIRKKSGELIICSLSVQSISLDGMIYFVGVLRDITEHKRVEEQIAAEKNNFQKLFAAAPVGLLLIDENILILRANQAIGEMIQRDPAKMTGKKVGAALNCAHTFDDPLGCGFGPACASCPVRHELEIALSDGPSFQGAEIAINLLIDNRLQQRWLRFNAEPIEMDGKKHVIVAFDDVTKSKELEYEIQENERRLALAISATADAIWEWNLVTDQTYYSPRWYEMLGYADQEFSMDFETWRQLCHPDDFQPTLNAIQQTLSLPESKGYQTEFRMKAQNGSWVWILGRGNVVKADSQGHPILVSGTNTDITARKLAEEAIRVSEVRLRRAELASRSGNWELHLDTRTMIASEGAAKVYGLAQDRFEYEYIKRIPLPEYRPQLDAALKNLIEKDEPYDVEFKIKTADTGEMKDIRSIASYDKEKGILFGAIQDITQRKQIEDNLRESEARYRALFEQSPDGVVILNPKTTAPIEFNDQVCRQLGYTREEFSKLLLPDIEVTASLEDSLIHIQNIIRTGRDDYETRHRTKQGEIREILVTAHLIYAGKTPVLHCLWRDITERKKAEEALRESEERFHSMFQEHGAVMLLIEPHSGQFLDANAAAQEFYGYPLDTLRKMSINDVNILPADEVRKLLHQALNRHQNYFVFPHRLANGQIRTVEIHSTPIKMGGSPILFSIIHDVTERKQAEESLTRQAERLRILHIMERAITSSLELQHIMELLADEVVKQLRVDACALLLLNPQTNQLEFTTKKGFQTQALNFTKLKIGAGLAGKAALEHQIIYIANLPRIAQDDPSLVKAIQDERFVSYFGVPLIAKNQVLGVMEIFHRTELTPDPDWLDFLDTLADQAAISIDNVRLLEMTQQSLKETNALYHINQDLIASIDAELLMKNVVDLLQKSFGYYYVQIFVADPKSGDFVLRAGSGEIGEKLMAQRYSLSAGEGIVGFTAETGKPFFTNAVDEVISFVRMPHLSETNSELAVPIKAGERFLGLLDVHQTPPALLTERDMQLVSVVANQLAVALQKAQMYADLQEALQNEQATRAALIQAEKLTLAGRLMASVSHELNNPIQAIQNALFLLKEEKGISAQGRQDLEIVLSETDRMATMLERLRATYQPTSRDAFQPVQVNVLIEDTCALVATHLRHSGISYAFQPDTNLPTVSGIANQLRQVILNLIMNAVDAMPKGGHLTLSTEFLPTRGEVLVKITDTGTGIDIDILPNIFEAFITNKDRGTGLGLAISYEIILKHHGRIKAENNPNQGATLSIWLPVYDGDEE